MNTPFLPNTHARIRPRYGDLVLGTLVQKRTADPCVNTAFVSYGAVTALHSVLSSCFNNDVWVNCYILDIQVPIPSRPSAYQPLAPPLDLLLLKFKGTQAL